MDLAHDVKLLLKAVVLWRFTLARSKSVIIKLCCALKPGSFCVIVGVLWGHQLCKFAELVELNRMNWLVNDISTKFVGKTKKLARARQVGGSRVSCMLILSPLGITKFWTKLAEAELRRINLGYTGVTSAEMRPRKGSRTGFNWRKKSLKYVAIQSIYIQF